MFIDEIAFLTPKDQDADTFYSASALPTIGDTNGYCGVSSTPNGKDNLFYDLVDPEGIKNSDYIVLWFNWEINKDNDNYRIFVEAEKKRLLSTGRYNLFRQEFMGDFTVTEAQFFSIEDIDLYFDSTLVPMYEWKKSACSLSYDFGISKSRTVLTVKTLYRKKVITLYRRAFPFGYDINELLEPNNEDSIQKLMQRYNIQWIIPDKCPQGDMFIKKTTNMGYPVQALSFQDVQEKNRTYYTYRSMLKQGMIKGYNDDMLRHEMIGVQEEQLKKYVSIGKSPSGHDDIIDSDVLATVPFFVNDQGQFGVVNTDDLKYADEPKERGRDGRAIDHEWESLKEAHKEDFKKHG